MGFRNVRLRDNSNVSSSIYTDPLNLTAYTSVTIDFLFYANSMESGENFFVEYNDGTGYVVIANYRRGIEFNNNITYNPSITLNSTGYTFSTNSRFRIRCDASANNDHVYIDDINITGVLPPPVNDDCANAITIVPDAYCTPTLGNTISATQSLSGCAGTADDDVWFSFTALSTEHTIEVNPTTLNDAVIQVFDNCGGTSLACMDNTGGGSNESLTLTGLTIGNTYYIRVYSYYSNANQQGEFNICITSPPVNDDCSDATTLVSAENCVYTTATTYGASQSLAGCAGTADDDVWFSFTALNAEHTIEVNPTTLNDAVIQVFDNCGGTSLACMDNTGGGSNESLTLTGLTIGNTYYIRVYSYYSNANQQGEFNICITSPPVNDDCINAITLTSSETCSLTRATTINATPSSPAGCVGSADDDVWFSFTALTSEHTIYVDPVSLYDAVIEVFDSCGGTSIACRDGSGGTQNEILTITSLTAGNTYYIRIFSYYSNASDQGEFDICITNPCTPSTANGTSTLGCPFVELGGVGLGSTAPPPVACSVTETTIEVTYLELGDTSSYSVESIAYNPPFQFSCLANPVSVNLDDVWSPVINLPFDFCFYDNTYSSIVIGSNGVISFDTSLANGPTGWRTTRDLPNIINASNGSGIGYFFGPSIYGVHHDVDPSISGEIGYQLITLNSGCQALVAAWSDVPMFLDNSILYSGMIVFYENTNIIEVYAQEKNIDGNSGTFGGAPWNEGNASIGIQRDNNTATVPPNRNTLDPNWTATNEAWRFTPNGASIIDLKWYENSISAANEIIDPNDDNQIIVSPEFTTTYFAEVTYTLCDGSTIVETNDTTVTIEGHKIWNGSNSTDWNDANNWTPTGAPISTDCIKIPITSNNPVMSGATNGTGYNLEIGNGSTLTQLPNTILTIEDAITIEPTGDLEIRDSASIIQITDVNINKNTGSARVQRKVNGVGNYDYVYWSSPVDAFDVEDISPGSPNYAIYKWTPTIANGTAGQHGNWINTLENMDLGKGYIVRGLIGNPITNTAEFSGKLNNGKISYPISRGSYTGANYPGIGNTSTAEDDNWNLLGNPYPSAISLKDFVLANPAIDGTLYLWQHLTPANSGNDNPFYEGYTYNYSPNDYLAANSLGSSPPGFNGFIASGQGFFALMLDSAPTSTTISYNNTMRGVYANDGFYRSASNTEDEKHRIWLDFVNEDNVALSTLVGFANGATDAIDRLYDGFLNSQSEDQFYSIISEQRLIIQGKALPFEDTKTVPLGYKASSLGNYTISINQLDGLFSNMNQGIYIEDTTLNIIHDLRANPYVFTTDLGTFNDRFILRFNNRTLSIKDQDIVSNLNIRTINKTIDATSTKSTIKTFELFDVTGRLIHKNLNVDSTNYSYQTNHLSSGTYIVTVSLSNGSTVSKKLII